MPCSLRGVQCSAVLVSGVDTHSDDSASCPDRQLRMHLQGMRELCEVLEE